MVPSVLIVGAGPTGLVLALFLRRHGIPVRIVDKRPGPGLASRAMVVQARTLELYDQIGIADDIVAAGIPAWRLHLKEDGKDVAALDFADFGAGMSPFPYVLSYPQDDHERFLTARLAGAGVDVEWNTALSRFSQDTERVRAVLDRNGVEETAHVAYLCGCDGAHSTVRQWLGLDFAGGTYEHIFYVADVALAGGGDEDIHANLGATGLGLVLPVRSTGMKRLIGTVPEFLHDRSDLAFADLQAYVEDLLKVQVEAVNWFSTYHVHHRVAERFRVDRVFIAGDAGHIHSPAGGQGMNTGIGDAINLSWKLAQVLQGRSPESLLDTYASERMAFAHMLVRSTDLAFRGMVGRRWSNRALRTLLLPTLAPLLSDVSAIRRLLFATVSQMRVSYRDDSALSEGEAGHLRGGDRLPWVPDPAPGNFAALKSVEWQLHIYGKAEAALERQARIMDLPAFVFPWNEAAETAGLVENAAYLIRPDGHIALCLPDQDGYKLDAYAGRHALHFHLAPAQVQEAA